MITIWVGTKHLSFSYQHAVLSTTRFSLCGLAGAPRNP